jgi:hypothetical protein
MMLQGHLIFAATLSSVLSGALALSPSTLEACLAVPNCTVANNPLYGVRNGTAMPPCLVQEPTGGWSCYNAMDDTGECPAFATMDCRVMWSPSHLVGVSPPMPVCRSSCCEANECLEQVFTIGVSPGVAPPCWYVESDLQTPNTSMVGNVSSTQHFSCFAKKRGVCPFARAGWDCETNKLVGTWTFPNL